MVQRRILLMFVALVACGESPVAERAEAPFPEPDAELGKADGGACPEGLTLPEGGSVWNALYSAFRFHDAEIADAAVSVLEQVDRPECFRSWTPMLWRAVRSEIAPDYVARLVAVGMDPNVTDFDLDPLCSGCTGRMDGHGALHYATMGPNDARVIPYGYGGVVDWDLRVEIVETILAAGGDPDQMSAGALLSGGNQVGTAPVGGATPLLHVAKWEDESAAIEASKALLAAGATADVRSLHGTSPDSAVGQIRPGEGPVAIARRIGHDDLVAPLLVAGAIDWNLGAEQEAALSMDGARIEEILATEQVDEGRIWTLWGSERGDRPPLETLLDAGLDPNVQWWGDKSVPPGAQLLHAAAHWSFDEPAYLAALAAGGDRNGIDGAGETPLLALITWHESVGYTGTRDDIASVLLEAGAEIEGRGADGDTPLIRMFYTQPRTDLLAVLLKAGADVNAANDAGQRPLNLAVKASRPVADFDLLLEHGADINAPIDGVPLWAYAIRHNTQYARPWRTESETLALLDRIVAHPNLEIDLSNAAVIAKLDEAATIEHLVPYVDGIYDRASAP